MIQTKIFIQKTYQRALIARRIRNNFLKETISVLRIFYVCVSKLGWGWQKNVGDGHFHQFFWNAYEILRLLEIKKFEKILRGKNFLL
jgi:hypothetical protein